MSYKIFYFFIVSLFVSIGCTRQPVTVIEATRVYQEFEYPFIQSKGKTISDFVPPFWSVDDTIYEDLNGDGKADALLLLTYNDTTDSYEYPKGKMNYQLFEQRVLLVLYKNKQGYTLNTYCYKLLNFNGGMGRGDLRIEAKGDNINLIFGTTGNGMYYLYYYFEPETNTGRWLLKKSEEDGGNGEYGIKASYNFNNDSLHYHSMHWNNDENDTTWTDYSSDLDTTIKAENYYYLDSMECGDAAPSNYLPAGFFERGD
jgi:hypothetical protein